METKNKILAHCGLCHHITWSTLVQTMAWCLGSRSHYLNQCWLSKVVKLSYCIYLRLISLKMLKMSIHDMSSKMTNLLLQLYVPEADKLMETWPCTVFTESKEFCWCQLCHHWWHQRLSLWQPQVPPMMTRMESDWQLSGFSYYTPEQWSSVCPSVRLSHITCPLCRAYSSGWIHYIFIQLIKQLQKVCRL